MPDWKIIEGDCRDVLRLLPAASVHTVVTSPPYFGLRDYDTDGQIGLELTPDEFVAALVAVFREVRRVLRDDGTVWLNLGDSYAAVNRGENAVPRSDAKYEPYMQGTHFHADLPTDRRRIEAQKRAGVKSKDLLGVPWMVAFALRADGWYLRSDIVWSKPNPMPESVTDRPTKAHEYVFLLSKGPRYFYDADAIREDAEPSGWAKQRAAGVDTWEYGKAAGGTGVDNTNGVGGTFGPGGRNKRSVWTVATQPYAGAHFATFPPKLIEPCILAGAPERACGECGASWVRVVEKEATGRVRQRATGGLGTEYRRETHGLGAVGGMFQEGVTYRTVGFEPSCSHGDGSARGVVLDPFAGAGTTGLAALQHGREFVGIELNSGYAQMARERIKTAVRLGFRAPQKVAVSNGQGSLFD